MSEARENRLSRYTVRSQPHARKARASGNPNQERKESANEKPAPDRHPRASVEWETPHRDDRGRPISPRHLPFVSGSTAGSQGTPGPNAFLSALRLSPHCPARRLAGGGSSQAATHPSPCRHHRRPGTRCGRRYAPLLARAQTADSGGTCHRANHTGQRPAASADTSAVAFPGQRCRCPTSSGQSSAAHAALTTDCRS